MPIFEPAFSNFFGSGLALFDYFSYHSLFDVAIEREAKSVMLYEYASDFVTSEFKKLLESLAEFEKAHERYIKKIRQDYRNK